jgi:hypothetical protein
MRDQVELTREIELARPEVLEPAELPLRVAPDWDEMVRQSTLMTRLIDRHLDYEERGRRMLANERLSPIGLCPEQRVNMVTDVLAVSR